MSARLDALVQVPVRDNTWKLAIDLAFTLRRKGITVPYMDLLISALAIENNLNLLHADSHFDIIAKNTNLNIISFAKQII